MLADPEFEELRQHWQRLRAQVDDLALDRQAYLEFFENLPEPALITDQDANIVSANRAAAEALGFAGAGARRPLISYLAQDSRQTFRSNLLALAAGRAPSDWRIGIADTVFRVSVQSMAAQRLLCWVLRAE